MIGRANAVTGLIMCEVCHGFVATNSCICIKQKGKKYEKAISPYLVERRQPTAKEAMNSEIIIDMKGVLHV